MKTTVSLFLFVTILLLGSGCKTTNLATEKVRLTRFLVGEV